jgi:hypothetical protein
VNVVCPCLVFHVPFLGWKFARSPERTRSGGGRRPGNGPVRVRAHTTSTHCPWLQGPSVCLTRPNFHV